MDRNLHFEISRNCTPEGANYKTNAVVSREKPGDSLPFLPSSPAGEKIAVPQEQA
jgi:hypothetical protein